MTFIVTPGVTSPDGISKANSYSSTWLEPIYHILLQGRLAKDINGNIGQFRLPGSATTNAAPDTTPPAQVQGLKATTVVVTRIDLAWTQNTDPDLAQYLIYKGTSSAFIVTPGVTSPDGISKRQFLFQYWLEPIYHILLQGSN